MDAENDDFDIDPELAASMGFAAFGTQPNAKKRKFAHNDAVVDIAPAESKSGANATQLGIRPRANEEKGASAAEVSESNHAVMGKEHGGMYQLPAKPMFSDSRTSSSVQQTQAIDQSSSEMYARIKGKRMEELDGSELAALSKGVRNEAGDMAYFKPSFFEDPWERLKSKGIP